LTYLFVKKMRKNIKYIIIFFVVIFIDIIINIGFLLYSGGSHKSQLSFIDKFLLKLIDYF